MIEKNRRYIETTIRIFESYKVNDKLIRDIADAYNDIAKEEISLIKLPLLNKDKTDG